MKKKVLEGTYTEYKETKTSVKITTELESETERQEVGERRENKLKQRVKEKRLGN